jgi:hypothetical protein
MLQRMAPYIALKAPRLLWDNFLSKQGKYLDFNTIVIVLDDATNVELYILQEFSVWIIRNHCLGNRF